ncbi:hypothetical protein DH2020_048086 [Rehmannia glutinosa]|uniref:PRC-barrel-like protein n=1 Tax=Rehmannia glutinosa TaxID=99300 RepID=A0ABR0U7Q9_REHGL
MYDCLPTINFPPQYSLEIHKFVFTTCLMKLPKHGKSFIPDSKKSSFSIHSARNRNAIPYPSDEHEGLDFGLKEKENIREFHLKIDQKGQNTAPEMEEPSAKSGIDEEAEDLSIGDIFKFRAQKKDNKLVEDDGIAKSQGLDSKLEELERHPHRGPAEMAKSRRQMLRRSNIAAKQVISIRSALSLGFVSQLWVDTSSWVVMVVEVRPTLLSGDFERLLLKEIKQVGDVMLVEDDNVIEDDFKLVGLETLVGYTVVTPNRQSIGKVRDYTFNINSGNVESLELDSFGISIIPSSLVSTYALFVEDVLEVFSDTVVVREAAVSRMQRLTKGFWDGQNAGISNNEFEDQLDTDEKQDNADYTEKRRKKLSGQKFRPKIRKNVDDWELPMDYL